DGTAEHVVAPPELAGALDGDDVLGLLDHADDGGDPARVAADLAALLLRDVAAHLSEPDAGLDLEQRVGEAPDVGRVLGEQVEGDPLGALGADPGQSPELVDQILDRTFVHTVSLAVGPDAAPARAATSRF